MAESIDESKNVALTDDDLDMIKAAGLGIAFRAKPVVAEQARAKVSHGDLTALLYAQGYRRAEFV